MGITLNVRDAYQGPAPVAFADLADNFDRADGELKGSALTVGGKTWSTSVASGTPQPKVVGGVAKAVPDMTGNIAVVVNAGSMSYDLVARVAATAGANGGTGPVTELIANYASSTTYVSFRLRSVSDTVPRYVLTQRAGGGYVVLGYADRVPAAGDVMMLKVRGTEVEAYVNGDLITSASVAPAGTIIGMLFNSADTTTAFDDLCLYYR